MTSENNSTKKQKWSCRDLDKLFREACSNNDMDEIAYLIKQNKILKNFYPSSYTNGTVMACNKGNLGLLSYILLNTDVDIEHNSNILLNTAVDKNHLHIVEFLLTSPQLKKRVDARAENDLPIRTACLHKNIEMMRFLLTSPEIKFHANVINSFHEICKKNKDNEFSEVIQYIVFEYKIKRNEFVNDIIESFPEIEKLFKLRELNNKLNQDLEVTDNKSSRFKV